MTFFKRNPFFYSVLLALLAACIVGVWYLAQLSGELSKLVAAYDTKASQYDRYLAARPSPTRSNLEALQSNYSELYQVYDRAMRNLNLNTYNQEAFFGATPRSRADWSFELHKYKENARYNALSNSIELPAGVDFGFEDVSDGGPPSDAMDRVHQQIVILGSLLETLFDSGISGFVKAQRGVKPIGNRAPAIPRRSTEQLFTEGDEFSVLDGESIAIPGTIDSYMFRVVFRGQSIALRGFLNRVSNSPLPFVIRGVEADLSSEGGEKRGLEDIAGNPFFDMEGSAQAKSGGVPIISDNTSLFVVTIEFLQLSVEVAEPAQSSEGEDAPHA